MSATDPWLVSEGDYPKDGLVRDWLRFAVRYAILAPSSHNSQPWLFHFDGATLELYADRARALPVADPHNRELVISCGAALFHLRVALHHFGHRPKVTILPNHARPDLLATVQIDIDHDAPPELPTEALFTAIPRRRTHRKPFEPGEVFPVLVEEFQNDTKAEGATFIPITDHGQRQELAQMVAAADREQLGNPAFRAELAEWLHWNRSCTRDGIPGYAFGLNDLESLGAPLVVRTFEVADGRAAADQELAEHSPLLAVILTEGDEVRDWLASGQALARVLLRGTANGVGASHLNQPVEVGACRSALAALLNTRHSPQIVLRMGLAPLDSGRPTPRRGADEVFADQPPQAPQRGAIH